MLIESVVRSCSLLISVFVGGLFIRRRRQNQSIHHTLALEITLISNPLWGSSIIVCVYLSVFSCFRGICVFSLKIINFSNLTFLFRTFIWEKLSNISKQVFSKSSLNILLCCAEINLTKCVGWDINVFTPIGCHINNFPVWFRSPMTIHYLRLTPDKTIWPWDKFPHDDLVMALLTSGSKAIKHPFFLPMDFVKKRFRRWQWK